MQNITPAQFAQILENIDVCDNYARARTAGKDFKEIYESETGKDLVYLFVATQYRLPNFFQILANILCDLLRPLQANFKNANSLAVLPAIEAWGRSQLNNEQIAQLVDKAFESRDADSYYAAIAAYAAKSANACASAITHPNYLSVAYSIAYSIYKIAEFAKLDLSKTVCKHAPMEAWDFSKFVK